MHVYDVFNKQIVVITTVMPLSLNILLYSVLVRMPIIEEVIDVIHIL